MNKPDYPFYKIKSPEGNILEPYLDKKGLHFPTPYDGTVYDQYIPREILYQLIDEYLKDRERKEVKLC